MGRWLYQHILIWFCLWSKMVLPFASAVKIFENAFSKFPASPFVMSVIVPWGWGIWSLIEDLQCQLGRFGVWANGPLQNLNILGNQSLFIPYNIYIYMYACTRLNPSPDIIHIPAVPHKAVHKVVAEVSKIGNYRTIGEVSCCGAWMAERIHWWTERRLWFLEWLQWSPHPQLQDVVWLSEVQCNCSCSCSYSGVDVVEVVMSSCCCCSCSCSVVEV